MIAGTVVRKASGQTACAMLALPKDAEAIMELREQVHVMS